MNVDAGSASDDTGAGAEVLEALTRLPGGAELLRLGGQRTDAVLIGGAVRDLLLGRTPRELDVVVEDGAAELARELAASLGTLAGSNSGAIEHERFRTALVWWEGGRIDIAERRAESYPCDGALPEVRAGTIEQDLQRRDFSVNAIAVPLGGPRRGVPSSVDGSLDDLRAGRLRVLHERSFLEDPTRLLRLARYRARLGFEPEPHTAALAATALAKGALGTISGARIGAELRLALAEADAVAAIGALSELGVLAALEPRLRFDERLVRRALALLPSDGRADLLVIASLLLPLSIDPAEDPEPVMYELLDRLEFTAADRERVMRTALVAPGLQHDVALAELPSELHEALSAHTLEAIAIGGALGEGLDDVTSEIETWFDSLRHVQLEITGQDLLDAGIPAGSQIGYRLGRALACKLDGELDGGREAELAAALAEEDV